jgi:exopolyphosphatase/guanosine-5'-triphosphate,3'-diphosphate pyrophosphatase
MEWSKRPVAVVEVGSTGIRLLVAEIAPDGHWRELDRAEKPVALGRDVFTSGRVTRESFMESLSVLRHFRELLQGWGIAGEDVQAIATSALRAARNREVFADRVRRETGFRFSIVEGLEENRLMYLAVRFALKDDFPQFWLGNSMIIEIGGGSTEIMLLRGGRMVAAHSLRLGTILIDQRSRQAEGSPWSRERFLNESIRNTAEILSSELDLAHIKTLVTVGSDARVVAAQIGAERNEHCRVIGREQFIALANEIRAYTTEEAVRKFHISFGEAEGFIPGILVYKQFLEQTNASQILVPQVSIREGFLIDRALGVEPGLQGEFFSQIIASAVNLGRKYHCDETHHRHVADLSLLLFDALAQEHGMNRRERMMLEAAAILHDIGVFIRSSGHNRHGQYIVAHSEIFGLRREELAIIATVIRYHRGDPPQETDLEYAALPPEDRILVLKMAAILRVADALDRGHSRQIENIAVERKGESLIVRSGENHDLSLEHLGLEEKADLFQDVFGYKVILT